MTPSLRRVAGAPPAVIAHRGASADHPENTMAAFEAAWAAGASWLETDVQPTVDGVPVLLHDDSVERTTGSTGTVRALTSAQLAELDAGSWFLRDAVAAAADPNRDPSPGSDRPPTAGAVHRIPTLAQLLAALTPGRRLLLEIKGAHTRAQVAAVLDVLGRSGADDRVLVQSFELDALGHVRALQPHRPVGVLVEDVALDPVQLCRDLGAVAWNPWFGLLDERPGLVAELHGYGVAVAPWTVDDPAAWQRLDDLGVDGLITNRPGALVRRLAGHGH
ncbi:glycerophosphodiester phosphodiesterase [Nakamurella endophytica]|uniref:glycerophosphodiester phosphodiesterase n=1 Tax=Nakamurella endophytica TaxID=1748367 RepID=UPI001666854D|nr:glycerophosphodiester phosphodiesterase family protein [Nakamurella endophytica]